MLAMHLMGETVRLFLFPIFIPNLDTCHFTLPSHPDLRCTTEATNQCSLARYYIHLKFEYLLITIHQVFYSAYITANNVLKKYVWTDI